MNANLRAELDQLWAAILALNENDKSMLTNVKRLSERLAVHEATEALDEMHLPRSLN